MHVAALISDLEINISCRYDMHEPGLDRPAGRFQPILRRGGGWVLDGWTDAEVEEERRRIGHGLLVDL